MLRAEKDVPTRVMEPGTSTSSRLRDLFAYRELISNLVRKELRVKYKNSSLGFIWSMLNPAMYLVIFWIVFTKFLGAAIPQFPIYLLSGLLGWNLWQASLSGSVSSLLGNANLVTKVYFPREVLPIATIGASLMHFFFQMIVLFGALIVFRFGVSPAALILVPAALITEVLLLMGTCLILAVLNVYFRDVQHLLELGLLAWFWMTPVVYPIALLHDHLKNTWQIALFNPMTPVVLAFQRGIYFHVSPKDGRGIPQHVLINEPITWYLRNVGFVAIFACVLVAVAWAIFRRLESRLAEEL